MEIIKHEKRQTVQTLKYFVIKLKVNWKLSQHIEGKQFFGSLLSKLRFCVFLCACACACACVCVCVCLSPSTLKASSVWGSNSRGQINGVVLNMFRSSATSLHRYFSMNIVIRNGKIVWNTGRIQLNFYINLKFCGWPELLCINLFQNSKRKFFLILQNYN